MIIHFNWRAKIGIIISNRVIVFVIESCWLVGWSIWGWLRQIRDKDQSCYCAFNTDIFAAIILARKILRLAHLTRSWVRIFKSSLLARASEPSSYGCFDVFALKPQIHLFGSIRNSRSAASWNQVNRFAPGRLIIKFASARYSSGFAAWSNELASRIKILWRAHDCNVELY